MSKVDESKRDHWHKLKADNAIRSDGDRSSLKLPGGGGISGDMDAPQPAWETRVSRLEMGFCAAFVLLITIIGGLYLYIGNKTDNLSDRIDAVNGRIGNVEVSVARIDQRTSDMDKKLDDISAKLDRKH